MHLEVILADVREVVRLNADSIGCSICSAHDGRPVLRLRVCLVHACEVVDELLLAVTLIQREENVDVERGLPQVIRDVRTRDDFDVSVLDAAVGDFKLEVALFHLA